MKTLTTFLLFFLVIVASAQNSPRIILNDSSSLDITSLHIKTNIVGNNAITIYDIIFYNAENRVLEGEFSFPLAQGQSVSHFAIEVNGSLRSAVIVEKEVGRVAYENTVRQTIDPGLLELTKGNNYKARIYPIPANGYKRLVLTYEEQLTSIENNHKYLLPLEFDSIIENFQIDISISGDNPEPIINNNYYGKFDFISEDIETKAIVKRRNIIPNKAIVLKLPISNKELVLNYEDYFNIYKSIKPNKRLKAKPRKITILWDTSYSMMYKDIEAELKLLDEYFKYLNNASVELVKFNHRIKNSIKYTIKNGDWIQLKESLKNTIYDGGTSYLDLNKYVTDEFLFFSDGMNNLGELHDNYKSPIYAINSVSTSNHSNLGNISTTSSGNYINLNRESLNSSLDILKDEVFRFLGITVNNNVSEVYPSKNTVVNRDFSVSGKFKAKTKIELLFGYTNEVTDTIRINLSNSNRSKVCKRIWAKQKLAHLSRNKKVNKEKIVKLAKKHQLISDFTSMIVLDRIEDYVRYKIEPPRELKAQYKELLLIHLENEEYIQDDILDRKEELFEEYDDLFDWYKTDFSKSKKKKKQKNLNTVNSESVINDELLNQTTRANNNVNQTETNESIRPQIHIDSTKRIINGTVLDQSNMPLPGVNVIIKGTTIGTQTDFDGNFIINAEFGDIMSFSYIGLKTTESLIGDSNVISAIMLEDAAMLDEVVVTALAGRIHRKSLSYTVATVSSESIGDNLHALAGKIAGVQIESQSMSSNLESSIIIRGASTINTRKTPLYVIDGIPYSDNESKNLDASEIDTITVLKDASALAIYGSKGNNGVIVITTKDGLKTNKEEIEELNQKINDELQIKPWKSNAEYLVELNKEKSVNNTYNKYLELRIKYKNVPAFFIDVADFFENIGEREIALTVLTNLIEIDLDNYELLKAMAYKLDYLKEEDLALFVYKEILELRPEEPQSYRDLALAYENTGEYQKAFDILYKIVNGDLLEKDQDERFYGIEHVAFIDACHLVTLYGKKLKLNRKQRKLFKKIKTDLRVVVDWNHNDTDIDLWVENPKEKISYKNSESEIGDRLSEDMMDGYGPEEYLLKKAIKGKYDILVDYYGDDVQRISGPTSVKVTVFKNYGSKNEVKKIILLRLDKEKDEIEVGNIKILN